MIKFGTGGFRGVIGDDFTKGNVQLVAQALSDMIDEESAQRKVVVGFDHRFGSDYFAMWMCQTLAANGVKSLLYTSPMPTPAIMTAVRDEELDYGIMITASHNPYNFNGVKLFVKGGVDADVAFTDKLEKHVNKVKQVKSMLVESAKDEGFIEAFANKDKYLDHIMSFISPQIVNNDINILYNNLYGVGAGCIVPLFRKVGIKNFTVLHTERDAFFGFTAPNPTEKSMEEMKAMVKDGHYTFAMATDSDSDRLGIIDEKGNYVSSNDILACLYYYLVKYRKMSGDIIKNCATSVLCDKVAKNLGYACHEVDVGFKNISAGIKQYDALIGGESSGGLTIRGYIFGKDSVFSSMLFTEMVVAMKMPVSEIVKEVHKFANYGYVCIEDEIRFESEEGIIDYIHNNTPKFDRKIVAVNAFNRNVKYLFENDCWALIRLSGTEPVFRVFMECESEQAARANVESLRAFIGARNKK